MELDVMLTLCAVVVSLTVQCLKGLGGDLSGDNINTLFLGLLYGMCELGMWILWVTCGVLCSTIVASQHLHMRASVGFFFGPL